MNISNIVDKYRKEINQLLIEIYPKGPKSLIKPINYVLKGKGKRLRPILAIFSAEACGSKKDDVILPAIAVELLHNFTLVHDDIMDQDIIRHGQETVHSKWDDGVAILSGDAMLSLALELINKSSVSKNKQMTLFIEGLLAVCEGQAIDKEFETQQSVSLDEYVQMIDLKTGYMIGLSAQIGATSADVDNETIIQIRDYGRLLGRAFQMQDDYLEIFSDSNNMGKSLESDILLGKKTFLMIQALEKNRDLIEASIKIAMTDFDKGINEIRNYMNNSGIRKATIEEIKRNIKLADEKLSLLSIEKDKLLYFSTLINQRGN